MKTNYLIVFLILLVCFSCDNRSEKTGSKLSFTKHIEFNHLYVVIDDSTYKYMFDSITFFNEFSNNLAEDVDAGEESWSGIYLFGKHNYLEIFKPNSYEGAQLGDVGLGFMTNKIGILDSLYNYWEQDFDSVNFGNRDFVEESGDTVSWFRYISIPTPDSLPISPWLMEHTKEHMLSIGFAENDIIDEVEYWDYLKTRRAWDLGITPDSVTYDKLFDKVTALHLTLSEKELIYLQQYLLSFGFIQYDTYFVKNDFKVKYAVTESEHYILNQVDFALLDTLVDETHSFNNLIISVSGDKASLKISYQ